MLPFVHRVYAVIFKIWRPRRWRKFIAALQPAQTDSLLDVGGTAWCWVEHPKCVGSICLVNTGPVGLVDKDAESHTMSAMVADGCALPFADACFDIAYSNSVIEHVGDGPRQAAFASEIRRVGRKVWVQTPAWECPFEPHFLAIGFHWLPRKLQFALAPWTLRGLMDKGAADLARQTRLLTRREMQQLFPDCQILVERLLGLPKSYIALRRSDGPLSASGPAGENQREIAPF